MTATAPTQPIVLRPDTAADADALATLAALDSRPVPPAPRLVAEVDGELRAAVSLAGGEAVADPFHRTASLVDLQRARAAESRAATPRRRARPRHSLIPAH